MCSWWGVVYVPDSCTGQAAIAAARPEHVVGPVDLRRAGEGVLDGEDGRQGLDVGPQVVERALDPERVLARHEGERLAGVPHVVGGEDGLVFLDQGDDVRRDVLGGDDGDPRPVEGGVLRDAAQPAARDRRAQRGADERAGPRHVVDVPRPPRHLRGPVRAGNAAADERHQSPTTSFRAERTSVKRNVNPRSRAFFGRTRWPSRTTVDISPRASVSAAAGTFAKLGRWRARPRAVANSRIVTGFGAVPLTAPETAAFSTAKT